MPMFKLVTTTTSYLKIDLDDEDDADAFADAIEESGEIDPDNLVSLLEDDICNPHDNLDVILDSQTTTAVALSDEEAKRVEADQPVEG